MAQKNITYDIGGKTKEASGSYYDDVSNTLVVKNLTVNEISLPNLQDGIAFVSGTTISSSGGAVNGKVVTWNASTGNWGFTDPVYVDVNVANPAIPAGSDVSGSFSNTVTGIQVKSLSNVNTGTPLPVSRGGTGLNKASIPNGESLLIGNGSDPLTFLTASNSSTKQALLSNGTGWELTTGPADMTSSVEISIFTSSATWTRPAGTKAIRVLAQGGGAGGGSGANSNNKVDNISAAGGSGGAAGGFIDSGIFLVTEDSVPVVVGKGGKGAVYPNSGSAGLPGGVGFGTHFGSFINSQFYLQTYFVNKGLGGTLNSSTAVAGGASITYGADWRGPDRPVYNVSSVTRDGIAGGSATSTVGSSITWISSSYYGVASGAGGGARDLFGVAYNGGNGGTSIVNGGSTLSPNAIGSISSSVLSLIETNLSTGSQTDNIFVSSGGGGGAAPIATEDISQMSLNPAALMKFETNNDSVVSSNLLTLSGPAVLSTERSKFGTKSLKPSGNGYNTATIPGKTLAGNFTIEGWVYLNSLGTLQATSTLRMALVGNRNSANGTDKFFIGICDGGRLGLYSGTGTSFLYKTNTGVGVPTGSWVHIALVRSSNVMRFYINGVGAANTYTYGNTFNAYTISLGAADYSAEAAYFLDGFIDEFAIYNYAKYTSNFTPSNSETAVVKLQNEYIGGRGSNGSWGSGGGGGGASTNYTASTLTAYDTETISLRHFDLSEATPAGVFSPWGELAPDRSIYRNAFFNGTQNIVSTGSVGIPAINSLFPDGVLSSSAYPMLSSGWDGCFVTNTPSTTDNFTIESWFYLTNYGTSGETNAGGGKCYLLGDGYNDTTNLGVLLGINVATNGLFIWTDGVWRGTGSTLLVPALNTWNHVVLQKQGGTILMYLNGTGSSVTAASTVADNAFGYSLSRTKNTQQLFNGFAKEFMVTSRVKSASEIQNYYTAVSGGLSGSYTNPVGIKQGGDGGDGYVAVISYKY